MGLRDIVLLIVIFGSIPFILRKPFIGVLMWYWVGLMNPHRISWTLEHLQVAMIIGGMMLFSILISRAEQKRVPVMNITVILALFWGWMLFTTFFAFYPGAAWNQWDKVWKIIFTTFVAMMMLNSRERIIALVVVIVFSIGFFGVKGGIFTIKGGGTNRVWGPAGSFIADNNSMGLVLIMTIPLMFYLRSLATYVILRHALLLAAILSVFATIGTYSRGALLGISAMGMYLALKSRNKAQYLLLLIVLAPVVWNFMPEAWHARMSTIDSSNPDGSGQGRLMAWHMAFNLASDRITGGGFETFGPEVYLMYLPEVGARRTAAHSIYFQIMGDHGFIGLGLYLSGLGLVFLSCGKIIRVVRGRADLVWMGDLAAMVQVSLVGFAATGTFLSMAYFDLYFVLVAIVVGMMVILNREGLGSVRGPLLSAAVAPMRSPVARPKQQRLPFAPSPAVAWRFVRDWYSRL